jgi:hypothetical protein
MVLGWANPLTYIIPSEGEAQWFPAPLTKVVSSIGITDVASSTSPTVINPITAISFDDLEGVLGALAITVATMETVSFPDLVYVGGGITYSAASLTSWNMPNLIMCGGITTSTNNIVNFIMSSLQHITGAATMSSFSGSISHLNFGSLISISGNFTLTASALTVLNLTNLKYVYGTISFNLGSISAIALPELQSCSNLTLTSCSLLTTLSLPKVKKMMGITGSSGNVNNLTTVTLGGYSVDEIYTLLSMGTSNVTLIGAKLTAASVESILVALAYLNGSNGTTAWGSGRTVNLSGGSSSGVAALTGPAVTARATLLARSVTVTLNA